MLRSMALVSCYLRIVSLPLRAATSERSYRRLRSDEGWFRRDGTSDDKQEGRAKAAVKRPWDRLYEGPRHDKTCSSITRQALRNTASCADRHPGEMKPYSLPTLDEFRTFCISHTLLRGVLWSTSNSPASPHPPINLGNTAEKDAAELPSP
jgi:hypothetical protein